MKTLRRHRRLAAFTMVELLVAACISASLGLIIYGVASEGVVAFARNISINRSYANARETVDRISIMLQSAGHVPILVDNTGVDYVGSPQVPAGIRFWRYDSTPAYCVTMPALTDTTLKLDLTKPTSNTPPSVGDLLTIAALGFQAQVTAVSTSGTTSTVSFAGTVASNTSPVLTASALATATTNAAATAYGKITCLDWNSVAFIAINSQLRYYPTYISGTTSVTDPTQYKVLTYLAAAVANGGNPATPFSLGPTPSINVDLYAESPDYNNRTNVAGTNNQFNGLNTANTYTYIQTALSPRNPVLGTLRSPY